MKMSRRVFDSHARSNECHMCAHRCQHPDADGTNQQTNFILVRGWCAMRIRLTHGCWVT